MAHEWGHYISNRLISNAGGPDHQPFRWYGRRLCRFPLATPYRQGRGHHRPLERNLQRYLRNGTLDFGLGGSNGPSNPGSYFGIRRMPYSTDLTKNNQTFKNIQDTPPFPSECLSLPGPRPAPPLRTAQFRSAQHPVRSGPRCSGNATPGSCRARLVHPAPDLRRGRDRMKDYIVAGYKATPGQPTFLEGRDGLLSAIYASGNIADYQACLTGFAKRGAGVGGCLPGPLHRHQQRRDRELLHRQSAHLRGRHDVPTT